jgi:hypothetical protein
MTMHAAWPGWMTLIIVMAMIGPMMRMIFGSGYLPGPRWRRLKRKDADEAARLDEALAQRDEVIEDLQRRLSELESRLDFTERLLASESTKAISET